MLDSGAQCGLQQPQTEIIAENQINILMQFQEKVFRNMHLDTHSYTCYFFEQLVGGLRYKKTKITKQCVCVCVCV